MSRRRREGETKPELGFEVPEFDEAEFIRKETISFRTTFILFLYSVGTALLSFLVWVLFVESWFLTLLIAAATGYLLRFIYPALKVDISHFGRKEWTGTGFLYFFSWLAFFIFFTNPPLYDGIAPTIEIHVTPDIQEPGSPVTVTIVAFDNVAVDRASMRIEVTDPDGDTIAETDDFEPLANGHSVWSWELPADADAQGTYTVTARVYDREGGLLERDPRRNEQSVEFRTAAETLRVRGAGDALETSGDRVEVVVPGSLDVYQVLLVTDHGTTVRLDKDAANDDGDVVYFATAGFDGFREGNNSFHVRVEEHDSYWLSKKYGTPTLDTHLTSEANYTVAIVDPTLLGDENKKSPRERPTVPEQTPGPGALLSVGSLVALVAIARRRHG